MFHVPTISKTGLQRRKIKASEFGEIGKTVFLSPKFVKRIARLVPSLSGPRSPSNIARLIVSIVVDPIEAVRGRWSFANMRQKRWEALPPFDADGNAAPAIPSEASMSGPLAPLDHSQPCRIFRRGFAANRIAVLKAPRCGGLFPQAATRPLLAGLQIVGGNLGSLPAGAGAIPHSGAEILDGPQPSKPLSAQIYEAAHMLSSIPPNHNKLHVMRQANV